ncbi:hypothetical protein LINGRAHAP2_LOCUS31490 [Linum grandiflorum]
MFEDVIRHGPDFKPPSYHEVRETFLKEQMKEVESKLEMFKDEWKAVGCTIMSDGWTDKKRRSLCNFLVNSPKGTVFLESEDTSEFSKNAQKVFEMLDNIVEMVGEENVIQIVTDNASAYKAAGDLLMEKRKHLFWTPCAAHCIDLMLEDFDKNIKVHKSTIVKAKKITNFIYARSMLISIMKEFTENRDLIRPAVTRFATSYLTLGCLNEHKGELMTMFSSEKWRKSKFSSLPDGKRVQGIVLDGRFWNNVAYCLRAMMPLVKVLRMVDSDERPAMPFLFFELNNANEKIKSNFNNVESRYKPILKIYEKRWEEQMHRPLHYAAYWLNPKVHFSRGFNHNEKHVKTGLYACVSRLTRDEEEKLKIMEQLDSFHHARGMFSQYGSMSLLDRKHPADWVHTKRRNKLLQQKMNDLVYIMYNSKLVREVKSARNIEVPVEDIESDNEWICDDGSGLPHVELEQDDVQASVNAPMVDAEVEGDQFLHDIDDAYDDVGGHDSQHGYGDNISEESDDADLDGNVDVNIQVL